jgi:hypothetical protein
MLDRSSITFIDETAQKDMTFFKGLTPFLRKKAQSTEGNE